MSLKNNNFGQKWMIHENFFFKSHTVAFTTAKSSNKQITTGTKLRTTMITGGMCGGFVVCWICPPLSSIHHTLWADTCPLPQQDASLSVLKGEFKSCSGLAFSGFLFELFSHIFLTFLPSLLSDLLKFPHLCHQLKVSENT